MARSALKSPAVDAPRMPRLPQPPSSRMDIRFITGLSDSATAQSSRNFSSSSVVIPCSEEPPGPSPTQKASPEPQVQPAPTPPPPPLPPTSHRERATLSSLSHRQRRQLRRERRWEQRIQMPDPVPHQHAQSVLKLVRPDRQLRDLGFDDRHRRRSMRRKAKSRSSQTSSNEPQENQPEKISRRQEPMVSSAPPDQVNQPPEELQKRTESTTDQVSTSDSQQQQLDRRPTCRSGGGRQGGCVQQRRRKSSATAEQPTDDEAMASMMKGKQAVRQQPHQPHQPSGSTVQRLKKKWRLPRYPEDAVHPQLQRQDEDELLFRQLDTVLHQQRDQLLSTLTHPADASLMETAQHRQTADAVLHQEDRSLDRALHHVHQRGSAPSTRDHVHSVRCVAGLQDQVLLEECHVCHQNDCLLGEQDHFQHRGSCASLEHRFEYEQHRKLLPQFQRAEDGVHRHPAGVHRGQDNVLLVPEWPEPKDLLHFAENLQCQSVHVLSQQDHVCHGQDHVQRLQDHVQRQQDHVQRQQDHVQRQQDHAHHLQDHVQHQQDHVHHRQDHVQRQDHRVKHQQDHVQHEQYDVHRQQDHVHRQQDHVQRQQDHVQRQQDHVHRQQDHVHRQQDHVHRQQDHVHRQQDHVHRQQDHVHRQEHHVRSTPPIVSRSEDDHVLRRSDHVPRHQKLVCQQVHVLLQQDHVQCEQDHAQRQPDEAQCQVDDAQHQQNPSIWNDLKSVSYQRDPLIRHGGQIAVQKHFEPHNDATVHREEISWNRSARQEDRAPACVKSHGDSEPTAGRLVRDKLLPREDGRWIRSKVLTSQSNLTGIKLQLLTADSLRRQGNFAINGAGEELPDQPQTDSELRTSSTQQQLWNLRDKRRTSTGAGSDSDGRLWKLRVLQVLVEDSQESAEPIVAQLLFP